ncbi:unnamed protein product [Rhizophagus irregularis]|nr:unnamed protein product [Rhizophagus irregularis]
MVREEITLYLFNLGLLIIYFIKLSDYFNTSNRNVQPLNIVHSESFRKFIKELDPAFIIPDVKLVKQIIHRSYNSTFPLVQEFINNNSISINLTTDMWTGQNRQEHIRYSHNADNISSAKALNGLNWSGLGSNPGLD